MTMLLLMVGIILLIMVMVMMMITRTCAGHDHPYGIVFSVIWIKSIVLVECKRDIDRPVC